MANTFSSEFNTELNQNSGGDLPLILLEINHDDLSTPIRVVNAIQNTTSNGNEYIGIPFNCSLPTQNTGELPRAILSVTNVGKPPEGNSIVEWLEISGGGAGAIATLSQISRADPDTIEWSIDVYLNNVSADFQTINAELGYEDILNRQGIRYTYRPDRVPGLF